MGKKILRGLGILALAIILLGVVFVIYIKFNSKDIAKPDDSDLYPSSQILSKEDNAFYDFKKASDSIVLADNQDQTITDLASNKNWDSSLANKIVNDNAVALVAFNLGSWKKGYQDLALQIDLNEYNANTVTTSLAGVRKLAKISVIKSRLLFEQGKEKEAFSNTLSVIYAGQIFENSIGGNLINYLVGISIKGIGINSLQSMISNSHLTSGELKDYVEKIEKFKNNRTGLQETFKMEYLMIKNTKEQMIDPYISSGQKSEFLPPVVADSKVLLKSAFYYKPNKTQKLFVERYKAFVGNAMKNCNEIIPSSPKEEEISVVKALVTENAVGKILDSIIGVSLEGVNSKRCEEEFSVIKAQISLASQAYKIDNGKYPNSLSQLYPKYLSQDYKQFNGKDIIYNAETGEVSAE